MEIGSVIIFLAVILALARLGSLLFQRFGLSGLIGEILVGVVAANLVIGDWSFTGSLGLSSEGGHISFNRELLEAFSELGAIFLLFAVGLETRVKSLMSVGRAAMMVALLGVALPFVMGFAFVQAYDGDAHHAMFMGAAMVATSVGITARVIKDMKVLHTVESKIIIAAAVIDDVLGLIILALVVGAASSGDMSPASIALVAGKAAAFVLAAIAVALWVTPWAYSRVRRRRAAEAGGAEGDQTESHVSKLVFSIALCLAMAWLADAMGLAAIVGAFLAGMLLADYAVEWNLKDSVEPITALFLSFFFVNVGMQVSVGDFLDPAVVAVSAAVIAIAVFSKFVGCGFGARIGDRSLDKSSANIIGAGMIPRGEVGMIVAAIGLASGAMSSELYAVVVIMAVATTIIAPPLLARGFRKRYPCGCPEHEECRPGE